MGFVGENQKVKKMVFEETGAALEFGVCVGRFSLALFVCFGEFLNILPAFSSRPISGF